MSRASIICQTIEHTDGLVERLQDAGRPPEDIAAEVDAADAKAARIVVGVADPGIFLEETTWREEMRDCPLSLAAERAPWLALAMLKKGADPRDPRWGSSLLYSAAFGWGRVAAGPGADGLEVFARLLERGADPAPPVRWEVDGVEAPYAHSLLAYLIRRGKAALPFLELLYAQPGFDKKVWPDPPGEPLSAVDYAKSLGGEPPGDKPPEGSP